jgi:hypothetical protein
MFGQIDINDTVVTLPYSVFIFRLRYDFLSGRKPSIFLKNMSLLSSKILKFKAEGIYFYPFLQPGQVFNKLLADLHSSLQGWTVSLPRRHFLLDRYENIYYLFNKFI